MAQIGMKFPVLPWLDKMTYEQRSPGVCRIGPASQYNTLLASCFCVVTRELFDQLKPLSSSYRGEWAAYIAGFQDGNSGMFLDPLLKESDVAGKHHDWQYVTWQTTYFALAALDALLSEPTYPLRFLDRFLEENDPELWLASLKWSDPWLESNRIMFLASFLLTEGERRENRYYRDTAMRIFDWLDTYQNPETGYWDLGQGASLHNAMAGAFHFYFLYFFLGRRVHYPEQIINHTLSLQHHDGLFTRSGGGGACMDLDAIDILVKFSLLVDHRSIEIKEALTRAFQAILHNQNPDGGFCEAKRPSIGKKSRKRKLMERFGLDRLLHRPWQGRPFEYLNYSGWDKMRYRVDESDLWSTWFRPLALALISVRYPGEFIDEIPWQFRCTPTLGWHDSSQMQRLRDEFYS